MNLSFSPVGDLPPRTLSRTGDILTVDGEAFNFGQIAEGDTLPRDAVSGDWLASDVTRIAGVLHLTVVLPHGQNAPEATRFPAPITITQDGPVALPAYNLEDVE